MVIFQLLFLAFTTFGSPIFAAAVSPHATVYFSPEDQLAKRLMEQIEKEKKSIHICIYTFTHRGIANSLIDAKKRGVEVEVIVDRFSVKAGAPLQKLVEEGIPVYVWDPDPLKRKKAHRPLMHHKFCVFGMDKVWTGSFNFTYDATNIHQENVIVLEDGAIAAAYKGQFNTIKMRSCVPLGSYITVVPSKKSKRTQKLF